MLAEIHKEKLWMCFLDIFKNELINFIVSILSTPF
jgi:hypothetical protein